MYDKKLLTPKEASQFLRVPVSRIYYMIFHKQIPHLKLGASVRFHPDELNKWIESKKKNTSNDLETI